MEVKQNGKVTIGDSISSQQATLAIGNAGLDGYAASFKGSKGGVYIENQPTTTSNYGLYIKNIPITGKASVGINVSPSTTTTTSEINYGISSVPVKSSTFMAGVAGRVMPPVEFGSTARYGAAIYGHSVSNLPPPSNYTGVYAGLFYGDVRVIGSLYGNLVTPSKNSSSAISNYSEEIGDRSENSITSNLNQLQLFKFHRPSETGEAEESSGRSEATNATHQDELSTIQYGLAADQLRQVFPELVYEDENGNLSINYIEMIPLLVQALNEQQEEINQLKGNTTDKANKAKAEVKATSIASAPDEVLALAQNKPNPFSETTEIALTIPADVQTAAVFFYDMTGKQVAKQVITERGSTSITVSGSNLTEGMYLYSLIADGKVVATKKMILTK